MPQWPLRAHKRIRENDITPINLGASADSLFSFSAHWCHFHSAHLTTKAPSSISIYRQHLFQTHDSQPHFSIRIARIQASNISNVLCRLKPITHVPLPTPQFLRLASDSGSF